MEHDPEYTVVGHRVITYMEFLGAQPPEEVLAFHGIVHQKARVTPEGEWRSMYVDLYEALGLYPEDVGPGEIHRPVRLYTAFAKSHDPNDVLTAVGLLPRLRPFSAEGAAQVLYHALCYQGDERFCQTIYNAADFARQALFGRSTSLTFFLPRRQRQRVAQHVRLA